MLKKCLYFTLLLVSISLFAPERVSLDTISIVYGDSYAYAAVEYVVQNPSGTYH